MKVPEKYSNLFRTSEEELFPSIVNVEVYRGKCPCKCIHCPVGRMEFEERSNYYGESSIDPLLYKKIVDEIAPHPKSALRIHSVGEPLLWNELGTMTKYAQKKGVRQWLFTSLLTKNTELIKQLCENIDIIEVSINNANREEYYQEKGVDGFLLVKENIRIMRAYIDANKLKCRLLISRVQTESTENDNAFLAFWSTTSLADDVFVRTFHTYNNILEDRFDCRARSRGCLVHWLRFNISVDGIAVVCFNELFKNVLDDEIILGNVRRQKISEIWRSERLNTIRNCDIDGTYHKHGFSGSFPCVSCKSCNSIKTATNISEQQLEFLNEEGSL